MDITREQLIADLRALQARLPSPGSVPRLVERQRTFQNVGAYICRSGRLSAIIAELEGNGQTKEGCDYGT